MSIALKRKIERLEEEYWRRTLETADHYLKGRSVEDVEFFCVHGYLPDVPIRGQTFEPTPMSWPERWKLFRNFQRIAATKTAEELEFFCSHGYWPKELEFFCSHGYWPTSAKRES